MEYLQASQSTGRSAIEAQGMAAAQRTSSVVTPLSIRAAITVIVSAPILLVYPFMHHHFVVGLNVGGVKE